MIGVADTSPLCYLILIGEIDVLPKLYSQVLAPSNLFVFWFESSLGIGGNQEESG
jgi:hypothetical protein